MTQTNPGVYGYFWFNFRRDREHACNDAVEWNRVHHRYGNPAIAKAERVGAGWVIAIFETDHEDAFIVAYA